ncbi:hypothetical protein Tco_0542538, partial [Tanacetum coccineum]
MKERKSDETEEINIEEKQTSNVKSGDTEEVDLETTQSTARQSTITPRTLNFEEEASPSSPLSTARQSTITPRTLNFEEEAGPSSPLRPIQVMSSEEQALHDELGLESVSIQRIQGIGYGVLEFLEVGTTLDIFQNIHILYLQYDVLVFSGYGVLSLFP